MKKGSTQILIFLCFFYLAFLLFYEFPFLSHRIQPISVGTTTTGNTVIRPLQLATQKDTQSVASPVRPYKLPRRLRLPHQSQTALTVSSLQFNRTGHVSSGLEKSALDAWQLGTASFFFCLLFVKNFIIPLQNPKIIVVMQKIKEFSCFLFPSILTFSLHDKRKKWVIS